MLTPSSEVPSHMGTTGARIDTAGALGSGGLGSVHQAGLGKLPHSLVLSFSICIMGVSEFP